MNKRKTIISVVSILLALVLIAGAIAYGTSPGRRTCSVYPVSDIAMTNYWGDEKQRDELNIVKEKELKTIDIHI